MLTEDERDGQFELARQAAKDAGRDPGALEYTRRGSADVSAERVRELEDHGVHRVVVDFGGGDPGEQHDRMSEFAERFALTPG